MVGKGNLAVFEGSSISETGEATPTKIGGHAFDINPYLHKFFVGLRWPEPLPKCLPSASIILRNSHWEIFATFLKVKAYFKSIIEVIQT